jgi:hypothetical protein
VEQYEQHIDIFFLNVFTRSSTLPVPNCAKMNIFTEQATVTRA